MIAEAVGVGRVAGAWHAPPAVVIGAALTAVLFAQAFVRLRRRGRADLAPWSRVLLFAAALGALVLPLVSPLDLAGEEYLLSAHMLQHVLVGDVAAVLLVLAVRGPLLFFLVPPPILRPLASLRILRAALAVLLRPGVSFFLWVAAMLAWHVPAAYEGALAHPLVHDAEHGCFVVTGILVWTQLLDPARHRRLTRGGRIGFAIGLLALGHPVADALLFSPSPVYGRYAHQTERLLGIGAPTDQKLAGAIMLVEQLLTLGIFVAVQLVPLLRRKDGARVAVEGRA